MIRWVTTLAAGALVLGACTGGERFNFRGLRVLGLDAAGNVAEFGTRSADRVRRLPVEGLAEGESLVGVDFRPSSGALYGVGSSGRVFEISTGSRRANAAAVAAPFSPAPSGSFGADFEPGGAGVRLLGAGGENVRVDLVSGAATVDVPLAYAPGDPGAVTTPRIVAAAFGAGGTLYAIDSNRDALVTLPFPATGQVRTVGPLGVNVTDDVGFDIAAAAGGPVAFATVTVGTNTELREIDLATGEAVLVRRVASRTPIRSIAISGDEDEDNP